MNIPRSPCVGVCELDEANHCRGCMRSLAEVAAWSTLGPAEQQRVIDDLPRRFRGQAGTVANPPASYSHPEDL